MDLWKKLSRLLHGLLASLAALVPLAAQGLFSGPEAVAIESSGGVLCWRDWDRDGSPDLAVTHPSSGRISVLLNNGDGHLGAITSYEVGLSPISLAAGDLDGDAYPDLLVANSGSNSLSVLLNRGDGSFEPGDSYPLGAGPRVIGVADFDVDGALDTAASNLVSEDIHVLFGDGKGSFPESSRILLGDNPHHIAVADFDGDGAADLAAAHSGAISLFRSRGDGSFLPPIRRRMEPDPRILIAADFDEDGLSDLAVVTDLGDLLLLFSEGDGFFEQIEVGIVPGFQFDRLTVGILLAVDFDRDGSLDILSQLSGREGFGMRVHRGRGDGTFEFHEDVFLTGQAVDATLPDLDGDGFLEVVVTDAVKAQIDIFSGTGPGHLATREVIFIDGAPRDLLTVDLEREGPPGLVVLTSGSLHFIRPDPGEILQLESTLKFPGRSLQKMAVGDFDGDGVRDFACTDFLSGQILVFLLDEGGALERTIGYPVDLLPEQVVAADFDGDGTDDVVATDRGSGALSLVLSPGNELTAEVVRLEVGSGQRDLQALDIDGDGSVDLAVASAEGVRLLLGDGDGGFSGTVSIDGLTNVHHIKILDLDGNGTLDLVAGENEPGPAGSGVIRILFGVPDGEGKPPLEIGLDAAILHLDVFDVTRDGRPDLVVTDSGSLVILQATPEGGFSGPESYVVGSGPLAVVFDDFDLDGILDAVTADSRSGALSFLSGRGEPSPLRFRRGDADLDSTVNLTDAVVILERLYLGGNPLSCPDSADINDDGSINLSDAVAILLYMFQGGRPPVPPGPESCGPDPRSDELLPCQSTCI